MMLKIHINIYIKSGILNPRSDINEIIMQRYESKDLYINLQKNDVLAVGVAPLLLNVRKTNQYALILSKDIQERIFKQVANNYSDDECVKEVAIRSNEIANLEALMEVPDGTFSSDLLQIELER